MKQLVQYRSFLNSLWRTSLLRYMVPEAYAFFNLLCDFYSFLQLISKSSPWLGISSLLILLQTIKSQHKPMISFGVFPEQTNRPCLLSSTGRLVGGGRVGWGRSAKEMGRRLREQTSTPGLIFSNSSNYSNFSFL